MLRPCAGAAARRGWVGSRSGRQGQDAVVGNGVIGRDRFVRQAGGADGPVLVCFPWAEGSASTHVPFPEGASAAAEVLIVQCPGRQEWPTGPALLATPQTLLTLGASSVQVRPQDVRGAAGTTPQRLCRIGGDGKPGRSGASSFAADGAAVRGPAYEELAVRRDSIRRTGTKSTASWFAGPCPGPWPLTSRMSPRQPGCRRSTCGRPGPLRARRRPRSVARPLRTSRTPRRHACAARSEARRIDGSPTAW